MNPVVYLISGFRWSFYGIPDVSVTINVAMLVVFLSMCLTTPWYILKSGYRLKVRSAKEQLPAEKAAFVDVDENIKQAIPANSLA